MNKLRFFVDFDGTISTRDVVDSVLEKFARREWLDVEKDWQEGKIGSRECLSRQISFVVAQEEALTRLVDGIEIDAYFSEFLKKTGQLGIPVSIVSDGFDLFIEQILKKYFKDSPETLSALPVFCNRLYWTGKGLKAVFTGPLCAHGCANCKEVVIKKHSSADDKIIFVGDGLSDRYAAAASSLTFAKGKLLETCRRENITHRAYSNFGDVQQWLEKNVNPAREGVGV